MSRRNRERRAKGPPKYADAVIAAALEALDKGTMKPGSVWTINVRHDDWCQLLAGKGPCNCNPEVRPPERIPCSQEN